MLHRVLRRLVADHVQRPLHRAGPVLTRPGDLPLHVQVLADHHLRAHEVEHGPGPRRARRGRAGEQLLAPGQAQVPGEDRGRHPEGGPVQGPAVLGVQGLEAAVDAGRAAAGVGAVDDVVVDQGGGLEELEGRPGTDHRGVLRVAARRPPAPVAQPRTQPLAPGGEPGDGLQQRQRVRRDGSEDVPLALEEAPQLGVQPTDETTVLGPEGVLGRRPRHGVGARGGGVRQGR